MGFSTNADDIARDLAILRSDFDHSKSLLSKSFSAETNPYFDTLRAREGLFDQPPIEAFFALSTVSQGVASGVETPLTFTNVQVNTGLCTYSTVLNSSRFFMRSLPTGQRQPLLISIHAPCVNNTTGGSRILRFATYRLDGSSLGALEVRMNPTEANFYTQELIVPFGFNSSIGSIQIEVFQDSGSTMSISDSLRFMMMRFGSGGG